MLAAPLFDTYHTLKEYARSPGVPRAQLAFSFLRARTAREMVWSAFMRDGPATGMDQLYLRLGVTKPREAKSDNPLFDATKLAAMSTDERDDIYMKLCEQAGVTVTKEMLAKSRERHANERRTETD